MFAFARRHAANPSAVRRLVALAVVAALAAAFGMALLVAFGGPANAQAKSAEIDGTAALKWEPANVTIAPGGKVTFKISGGQPHPVASGTGPQAKDEKFDASKCGFADMAAVGDSCTVTFKKAGTYPYYCEAHFSQGMTGVITVGSGGGGGGPATTAPAASTPPVVTAPAAAASSAPAKPGVYWLGYGLLAFGALLALAAVVGYLRFAPGFRRGR